MATPAASTSTITSPATSRDFRGSFIGDPRR
jgi:hypothetical protein